MTTTNKRERNKQEKNIKLHLESNPDIDNNEDPQITTTISSYKNYNPNKTNKFKTEKNKFRISFNKTLKSQISKRQPKNFTKTKNEL